MMRRLIADRSNPARSDNIVACSIGDEQYALRGADACEIVRAEQMRRSPGSDGAVGRLYVNWESVPVYALGAVLDRPGWSDGGLAIGNHVVVTRGSAGMAGWLVDRIARPAIADSTPVIPLPAIVGPTSTRWFEGLLRVGDRSLLLLSAANLDPRAPSRPVVAEDRVEAPADGAIERPASDDAPPMVVLFSSPALPRCRAPLFALSARRIAAVIRPEPVTVVPGCGRHITGVIVWRDVAVPIVDVRAAAERTVAPNDRLVIARCGAAMSGALVAFPVGTEMMLHQPTRADRLLDQDEDADTPFVAGVFSVQENTVALLDLERTVMTLAG